MNFPVHFSEFISREKAASQGVACRFHVYVAAVCVGCRFVAHSAHRPYAKYIWYW